MSLCFSTLYEIIMYSRNLVKVSKSISGACHLCRHNSSWSSKLVRSSFITFFQNEHDHKHVASSSVVPAKGQGTYFTNAGMNQFKPLFLGTVRAGSRLEGYTRVVNSQKCIRVGGKHNDLDDVGKDLTHHTFFEMLGSWSFGDYFKKEACRMALQLLTGVYGLSLDRLYFTYFGGDERLGLKPDLECRDIWLAAGIPASQVLPFGMKDNFWDMGETGPCGPCTEIHFDHVGGRDASHLVNADSPDVVEIWNLVFMQYDRKHGGGLDSLPRLHVDTGMGLERMTAVLQGSRSNYDTDLFQPLFSRICKLTGAPSYQGQTATADPRRTDQAYRVVADHARMISVAVADGLLPGRDGLQHKLRMIIHRAIHELEDSFGVETIQGGQILGELSEDVVMSLGDTYPELERNSNKIKEVLRLAAEQFQQLQSKVKDTSNHSRNHKTVEEKKSENDGFYRNELKSGESIVQIELFLPSLSALQQAGVAVTEDSSKYTVYSRIDKGYDLTPGKEADGHVMSFLKGSDLCSEMSQGDICGVILDKTIFYSQSGGQAADTGHLTTQHGVFEVMDVQEQGGYILHIGRMLVGMMSKGDIVAMEINKNQRLGCMCNHTGTHLLNAALRIVLGDSQQMGSDVQHNKFTFDFSSLGSLTVNEVSDIEKIVRQQITAGLEVNHHQMELNEAMQLEGVTMLQNEDYPSPVRVISIRGESSPFHSIELCGGTHVLNTSDLEDFCVVRLTGLSQGTKRATCVSGPQAKQAIQDGQELEEKLSKLSSAVTSGQSVETWTSQVKAINTSMQEHVLPKLVRDRVQERLDKLGERINARQNQLVQAKLQQGVLDLLAKCSKDVTLHKMAFDGKHMTKVLSGIEITKPIVLVSEGERSSMALIAAPSQQAVLCKRLVASCKGQLDEFNIKESAVKCGEDKSAMFLTLKGRKRGSRLFSVLTTIVDSGISER